MQTFLFLCATSSHVGLPAAVLIAKTNAYLLMFMIQTVHVSVRFVLAMYVIAGKRAWCL